MTSHPRSISDVVLLCAVPLDVHVIAKTFFHLNVSIESEVKTCCTSSSRRCSFRCFFADINGSFTDSQLSQYRSSSTKACLLALCCRRRRTNRCVCLYYTVDVLGVLSREEVAGNVILLALYAALENIRLYQSSFLSSVTFTMLKNSS